LDHPCPSSAFPLAFLVVLEASQGSLEGQVEEENPYLEVLAEEESPFLVEEAFPSEEAAIPFQEVEAVSPSVEEEDP